MKKIVASVGLVALGASAVNTASAQAVVGPDNSKPWNVSVTLRGFYDDNTATIPNDATLAPGEKRDSFGYEISPGAALVWSMEQTTLNAGAAYSYKYFENRPPGFSDKDTQTFTFNLGASHAFSEQFRARVSDSFVIGQEPDMLRAGNTFSTFQHISGDNIRNYGSIGLDWQATPKFGFGFGYDNAYYDYKNSGAALVPVDPFTSLIAPSLSGTLDRMEHRAHLEGLYNIGPETKLLLGYKFMEIDYTADEPIGGFVSLFGNDIVMSDARNSREHTVYVGAEHNFTPKFSGSIRAGGSYTDYYNDSNSDAKYTPYVDATLKYLYAPGSSVQGGFSYDRNATDVVGGFGTGNFTLDAESAVVFASVTHQIDPRLIASLIAQFQNSKFNGGVYDNKAEQFYLLGIDLEYKINQFFSAHAGYNYDNLQSDILWSPGVDRSFDRNRVYIGVTASY